MKMVVGENGLRMMSAGSTSKLSEFEQREIALISLAVGFSRMTLCCENLPSSVLSMASFTIGCSSLDKFNSYHFSPSNSFTKAMLPFARPTYNGLYTSSYDFVSLGSS